MNALSRPSRRERGYLLTEVLVYIGLVFLLMGIAYAAMSRLVDNSVALRRNADDVIRSVHAGERWRADLRAASRVVHLENSGDEQILHLDGDHGVVEYSYAAGGLFRRNGAEAWFPVLDRVKSSTMQLDPRPGVNAWRWELELQPQNRGSFKSGRIRPLFTFLSVSPSAATP